MNILINYVELSERVLNLPYAGKQTVVWKGHYIARSLKNPGSAVGGSIEWNLLRLFSPHCFDSTARRTGQISQWQWKVTPISRLNLTCRLPDYHFSSDASSPTARFFIRSSDQSGNGTPALHPIFHSTLRSPDSSGKGTPAYFYNRILYSYLMSELLSKYCLNALGPNLIFAFIEMNGQIRLNIQYMCRGAIERKKEWEDQSDRTN